jgi:hypothetical protein
MPATRTAKPDRTNTPGHWKKDEQQVSLMFHPMLFARAVSMARPVEQPCKDACDGRHCFTSI